MSVAFFFLRIAFRFASFASFFAQASSAVRTPFF
jgi:hypothetical protein